MAYFVLAGKPDCPAFVHAIYVARYIEKKLPNFHTNIIQKRTGDWEQWLEDINFRNAWHHTSSPVIWKELAMRGGKEHYLGGLSEFWEYCYDYYGLESIISQENLQKMVTDNMQYFIEWEKLKNKTDVRKISIIGLYNPLLSFVLSELVQIEGLQKQHGIKITLYDFVMDLEESLQILEDIVEDITPLTIYGSGDIFHLADTIEDVISGCELLIIIGDYTRRENEDENDWLIRNMSLMFMLADSINCFAKRDLKVILAMDGPVCFNANVLIDTCTAIRIQNIVAVTSQEGLGPLKFAAEQAKVYLDELSAPPIWGFVGNSHFVDVESVIIKSDIYRPYQRVLKNKGGSTLPLGIVDSELRFMAYLIEDVGTILSKARGARKIIKKQLRRTPVFSKVTALMDLLKIWYSKEPSDEIISLGVCSNGSYGIPPGIVFSQPVTLHRNLWIPFKNFPLPDESKYRIEKLISEMLKLIETMNVGPFVEHNTIASHI